MSKFSWADLSAERKDWQRRMLAHKESPEHKAYLADLERRRAINREAWLAFAAAGWPVSRNLVVALDRQGTE